MDSTASSISTSGSALPAIEFKRTIPRELTHKRRIENVYLTALDRLSDSEFVCGAFVPHSNAYLNAMRAYPNDVMLSVLEVGRQMALALCHEYLSVDRGSVFIMNTMQFEIAPAFHTLDWIRNDTLLGRMAIPHRTHDADGNLRSAFGSIVFFADDVMVFKQSSDWAIWPLDYYRRFRRIIREKNARNPKPVGEYVPPFAGFKMNSSALTKASVLSDVLWAGFGNTSFAASLQVDTTDAFFFDHDNDHVPGMLVLEGMRELAVDIASRFPTFCSELPKITALTLSFKNFAELDYGVELLAQVVDQGQPKNERRLHVHVDTRQFGRPVAHGSFVLE